MALRTWARGDVTLVAACSCLYSGDVNGARHGIKPIDALWESAAARLASVAAFARLQRRRAAIVRPRAAPTHRRLPVMSRFYHFTEQKHLLGIAMSVLQPQIYDDVPQLTMGQPVVWLMKQ